MQGILSEKLILTEAAILERVRRNKDISLCSHVDHAKLIYSKAGAESLKRIYSEYIKLAIDAKLPLLLATPTWRASSERVSLAKAPSSINEDAVNFLSNILPKEGNVYVGGLVGCKNDCYKPQQSLTYKESLSYHRWQIDKLGASKADYLMGVTLPAVPEALGIASLMSNHSKPYFISFVIGSDGRLLDGHTIQEAISHIDYQVSPKPSGYFINCSHPSFLDASNQLPNRLIGIQANASSLTHNELENSESTHSDSISEWGNLMLHLNQNHGFNILGGCCGTDSRHLEYIINNHN
ncbi:homocysteine S-methyltransferase family protein [Microbulbifer sp. VAAF005]|uniref:homocysteine S-methyltransferase family protein n=1 Tax=Microbulbifer sp. VAAF005 TaxID=3034230 RepID=UPI0024AE142B|nr:homocysteine S-methyltransferase family protein [Microbulbifer sp. VAAF005]WHI47259.1 homocysteine S-methyltransferase family protein [Microbulbifer sp. VAAF005]